MNKQQVKSTLTVNFFSLHEEKFSFLHSYPKFSLGLDAFIACSYLKNEILNFKEKEAKDTLFELGTLGRSRTHCYIQNG